MLKKIYWFLFVHDLNHSPVKLADETGRSFKNKLTNDLSLLVLLSYSLFVFNPFILLLADVAAHTFWEKEHLRTAHHFNGKNHVEFEIAKAEKQTEKDKSKNNSKSGSEDFFHILVFNTTIDHPDYGPPAASFYVLRCRYPVTYPDIDYPPPRG